METGVGPAGTMHAQAAAHLFGRTPDVAKELIDFDRELAKMFSAPPKDPANAGGDGVDPAEFQKYFVKQLRFTAGTETRYAPSIISGEPTYQRLAEGLTIGMRFHSAPSSVWPTPSGFTWVTQSRRTDAGDSLPSPTRMTPLHPPPGCARSANFSPSPLSPRSEDIRRRGPISTR